MPLTAKRHDALSQLAERWNFSIIDLHYFAANGMLEVQAWVEIPPILQYPSSGSSPNEIIRQDAFTGYAALKPDYVRRVLREEPGQFQIYPDDLVVSRIERDRFERDHNILHASNHASNGLKPNERNAAIPPISYAGRPSIMRKITDHFMERCEAKVIEASLQKEGDYLFAWAQDHIKGVQIPTPQTIRTAIRAQYREQASIARV